MSMESIVVLLAVTSVCFGLNIDMMTENDPQCKFEGQQCSADLKKIIFCLTKGGTSIVLDTCSTEQTCKKNGDFYICITTGPDDETKHEDFICPGEGAFPDEHFKGVGYLCKEKGILPEMICECPKGMVLKMKPFSCTVSKMLEDCGCTYKDWCSNSTNGSQGALYKDQNTEYYYTCGNDRENRKVTIIRKCPDGELFVGDKCKSSNYLNKERTLKDSSDSKVPECKTYPCRPEENIKCMKHGQMLPHKIKRCYYYCDGGLHPLLRDCGRDSYFVCRNETCGCVYNSSR